MKIQEHGPTRFQLLSIAINKWAKATGGNKTEIADDIVSKIDSLGLRDDLQLDGVEFKRSNDIYGDKKANAQKIQRWMGERECMGPQYDKLFLIEQAIVAAMPEQIRIDYLNDVYAGCEVITVNMYDAALLSDDVGFVMSAKRIIKESDEAVQAVLDLTSSKTKKYFQQAVKELGEAAAVVMLAQKTLTEKLERMES